MVDGVSRRILVTEFLELLEPSHRLEAGQPLSEFLEDFPTVTREQAVAALEQAKEALLARARPA